ncbi:ROK family protein [Caproicibacter sp.]|uniref:ROK family protein n=1 Tax=Caproicibacter sp. TaxID=2814884 RepID=UPI0039896E10
MQPGIGATFLKDGEIYRGESYFSMEIGHTIIDAEGDYCPLCRRRGCLESIISIDMIVGTLFSSVRFRTVSVREQLFSWRAAAL